MSHLDPLYCHQQRRRNVVAKWKHKQAVRRQRIWIKDLPFIAPWGTRHASHVSKRWRDEADVKDGGKTTADPAEEPEDGIELSKGERRWRAMMKAMKERIEADPYEAIFGKRFTPFYTHLLPAWMRADIGLDPEIKATKPEQPKSSPDKRPKNSFMDDFLKPEHLEPSVARASSFRLRSRQHDGKKPTIEASATSWDSMSDKATRMVYDPITNRMVKADEPSNAASTGRAEVHPDRPKVQISNDISSDNPSSSEGKPAAVPTAYRPSHHQAADAFSRLPQSDLDLLTPETIRASMGKLSKPLNTDRESKAQEQRALETSFQERSDTIDKELEETRKHLAAFQSQAKSPSVSKKAKPEHVISKGVGESTHVSHTKPGMEGLEEYLKQSKDELQQQRVALRKERNRRADEITAIGREISSAGSPALVRTLEEERERLLADHQIWKEEAKLTKARYNQKEAFLADLQSDIDRIAELQSRIDSQLKERDQRRADAAQSMLEDEIKAHKAAMAAHEDHYSTPPSGMQTSFQNEKQDFQRGTGESLKGEIETPKATQGDGYSHAPIGLQSSYMQEQLDSSAGDRNSLEHELSAKALNESDDGYTRCAVGLQSSFEQERDAQHLGTGASLESELRVREQPHMFNDGYSTEPIGLQASFPREVKGNLSSLEAELRASERRLEHDDGYTREPIGLQQSFATEATGGVTSLEAELQKREEPVDQDDGFTTEPIGMQASYKAELDSTNLSLEQELKVRGDPETYNDGYSTEPIGMQASYEKELSGQVPPLESELKAREVPEVHNDGYSTESIGLQASYANEEAACTKGRKQSLEKDIQARTFSPERDDGYSKAPLGLESSFKKEQAACQDGQKQSLEQEIKSMQGEGDLCSNAAKFLDNDRWYKQPAKHSIADPKAEKKERDRALVRQVRDIYEKHYGTIDMAHRQPAAALDDRVHEDLCQALEHHEKYMGTESARSTNSHLNQASSIVKENEKDAEKSEESEEKEFEWIPGVNCIWDPFDPIYRDGIAEYHPERHINVGQFHPGTPQIPDEGIPAAKHIDNLQESLERHDKELGRDRYKFTPDNLAAELAVPATLPTVSSNTTTVDSSHVVPGTDSVRMSTEPELQVGEAPAGLNWAEPPQYQVLAYDSGNDMISTATTTSNMGESESPISISKALSQLYQPARFVPHFASLQSKGYQVVYACRDLLVFRKVKNATVTAQKPYQETEVRKDELAKRADTTAPVNPIDGTSRPPVESPTGNFASPTGFVNHDPVLPPPDLSTHYARPEPYAHRNYEDVDWMHYPRVRREERVFSGTRRKWGHHGHNNWRGGRKERRRWRDRITWALSVGTGTAVCMYIVGVGAELARGEREASEGGKMQK